jgi:methylamine dehydrogenase heavy chain
MKAIALRMLLALFAAAAPPAGAEEDVPPDDVGRSLTLPAPADHWVWLNEPIFRHAMLFDGDSGEVLGVVDQLGSLTGRHPLVSRERGETYVMETFYSRGNRGDRRDFVTIYDSRNLEITGEVEIPPRTADVGHGLWLGAVLDGGRFLVVFNQEPANSVSVVDLETRRFVAEITTAGCALVYPAGPRRFGMLCGDGTALLVELDDDGRQKRLAASDRFFDVVEDPLTEKGVRNGDGWLFASFEGHLYEIDFSGGVPRAAEPWSLFTDAQRADSWRIGGLQHLALHRPTGRLYSVVHQGDKGTHKDAGSEIWVYDLKRRERIQVIEPPPLLGVFLRRMAGLEPGSWSAWLLETLIPSPGVHSVVVTPDDEPLLFVRHRETGAAGVYDARSGELLRYLEETGLGGALMVVP